MLRTIFSIGIFTLLALFALNLVFSVFGGLFSILFWLFWLAVKIAVIGALVYLVIHIFSPETARKLRSGD